MSSSSSSPDSAKKNRVSVKIKNEEKSYDPEEEKNEKKIEEEKSKKMLEYCQEESRSNLENLKKKRMTENIEKVRQERKLDEEKKKEVTNGMNRHHRHHLLNVKEAKEAAEAYLHDPGPETVPRRSGSPSTQTTRLRSPATPSSSWCCAGGSPAGTQEFLLGIKGVSGGTGTVYKGMDIGTLLAVKRNCAATISGTFVPQGGSKTTSGDCNDRLSGQWEDAKSTNLRNGLGLDTPDAMPTASSQGNTFPPNFP